MLKLFKNNKVFPEYWNEYLDHFDQKKNHNLQNTRFVVFDTETTGLNTSLDRILSIGAVAVSGFQIDVSDSIELYVRQDVYNRGTVSVHGIRKDGHDFKLEEEQAIIEFLKYVKDAILVAHHASFDVAMINIALRRLGLPKLKNKVLDTDDLFKKTKFSTDKEKRYSLDVLMKQFDVKAHDRHTAAGDAYITALVFLKILASLRMIRPITLKDLFFRSKRIGLL
ncbi:PolC-type DNA polymerase III [Sungkyunkwania multivorans]|uniref:PolC-type DNA polymerase III n=1 Tax=Sungkyunkwania multivorans TaxID=1173618 RepID=A0ABW3CWR0_9FLAO